MRLNCILSTFAFILFFGIIAVFVLPSLVVYILSSLFIKYPQDYFQSLASLIYKIFFTIFPTIKLHVKLLEKYPSNAVYVSTHQSNLDYPILGYFIKKYLIMTILPYKKIPFISLVGDLIGVRYLNRNSLDDISKIYSEFEENLINGRNVIFFAEGTRQSGSKLGKFKKGAFRLAMKTNKPIIPIVINGTGNILPKGQFCFASAKKEKVSVQMLEAIYPENFKNEQELLIYTHRLMQNCKNI